MSATRAATMGAVEKIGRNDPCPCGSGRKYKLCCGALALLQPHLPARACGGCTACCEGWAESTIRGHAMHPGQPCHFLEGGRGGTCSIYADRPAVPCRNFECGWLRAGSPFPEEFRPDRCGVIIVPMVWRGRTAYVLLSAGNEPGPRMLDWMKAHARATGSPLFYEQQGQRVGYGPPEFQHEMLAKLQRGEKLW